MPAPLPADSVTEEARALRVCVASNVLRRAEGCGLTVARLAAHAGVRSHVLRAVLQGEQSASLATLSRLADALATTPADLLEAPDGT